MKNLFYSGIAMIFYDGLGHFLKFLAYKNYFINGLWNKYADYIWFSFKDDVQYNLFFSLYFLIALSLILIFRK